MTCRSRPKIRPHRQLVAPRCGGPLDARPYPGDVFYYRLAVCSNGRSELAEHWVIVPGDAVLPRPMPIWSELTEPPTNAAKPGKAGKVSTSARLARKKPKRHRKSFPNTKISDVVGTGGFDDRRGCRVIETPRRRGFSIPHSDQRHFDHPEGPRSPSPARSVFRRGAAPWPLTSASAYRAVGGNAQTKAMKQQDGGRRFASAISRRSASSSICPTRHRAR